MRSSLVSSCTTFMQPSKSVSSESTSAPFASGCTSCAGDTLFLGSSTIDGIPAAAQYAASAAEVSPVDAHATASIGFPIAIICSTTETSTVMPRSLNDPVCELPQSFTQRSATPTCLP